MILFLFSLLSPSLSFSLLNANASSACMMNINRKKQAAIISFGMPAKTIHPNQTHILYDEFQKERRKKNEPRTTPKFIVSWLLRDIASSLSFIHLFSFFFGVFKQMCHLFGKHKKKRFLFFLMRTIRNIALVTMNIFNNILWFASFYAIFWCVITIFLCKSAAGAIIWLFPALSHRVFLAVCKFGYGFYFV